MKHLKTYENLKQVPNIYFFSNGQKRNEIYLVNGKYHREDGPSYQNWYDNGQKERDVYYFNNNCHRENGPAVKTWYYNGQNKSEYYYLNGKEYSREDWLDKLKEIGSPHYQDQLLKYNAEKYNL